MRSLSGRSRRSGARPASSSSVRAAGSSSRASGLPPVTPTSSSRTTAGRSLSRSAAACAPRSPASESSGSPGASKCRASPSRAPMSTAIGSACRRRVTKTSASADAPSSQCASSITHKQRLRIGRRGQQAQDGHRDQEAVLDAVGGQPEGAPQSVALDLRQFVGEVDDRPQQLVQPRERQLRLGFDPGAREHPHPLGPRHRVLQQGGLADPRLAPHDEGAAARLPGRIEQAIDRLALALTAQQHGPTLRRTRGSD